MSWYFFINFIPLFGAIWFLVIMCQDSAPGDNRYGSNPKASNPEVPALWRENVI